MDSPGEWTAAALFSPSKARAQQAQAREWQAVDSWLAKSYGNRLPAFERNEETLQALLMLANVNEDADEHHFLTEKLGRQALLASGKASAGQDDAYHTLFESLGSLGREHLETMAFLAAELGTADTKEMARGTSDLTTRNFELAEQVSQVEVQRASLQRETDWVRVMLDGLRSGRFMPAKSLAEQTAEWTRASKQLKTKLVEYDERASALRASTNTTPSLNEVSDQANSLAIQQDRLTGLRSELSAYEGLPSDPITAKAKIEAARTALRKSTVERDRLFEELAEAS
ncbi:hypothetical protein LTR62_002320 [Meristemomyces frigidus]|uniref:HAUS augmin-like complex subunit 1 n=1 Tax=Meristemomyces frigidus TaxID=1508187 RepID=A0AAN7TL34_9PEZI|nr:hypothetical protein LTR62_002320 [Meristemomyces frigidus]